MNRVITTAIVLLLVGICSAGSISKRDIQVVKEVITAQQFSQLDSVIEKHLPFNESIKRDASELLLYYSGNGTALFPKPIRYKGYEYSFILIFKEGKLVDRGFSSIKISHERVGKIADSSIQQIEIEIKKLQEVLSLDQRP